MWTLVYIFYFYFSIVAFFSSLSCHLTRVHGEPKLRTQKEHSVVTRCFFQRPLQCHGDGPVVVFGISAAIVLVLCLPPHINVPDFDREVYFSFFNIVVIWHCNVHIARCDHKDAWRRQVGRGCFSRQEDDKEVVALKISSAGFCYLGVPKFEHNPA